MLPATNDEDNFQSVSTWHDAEPTLCRFSAIVVGDRDLEYEYVKVKVRLVNRDDNEYNPNAISVVMPDDFGGNVRDRHMGYLYDSYLRRVGMARLADLSAEYGEIECTGLLSEGPELSVDLPDGHILGRAIDTFMRVGAGQGRGSARGASGPALRQHTQEHEYTTWALQHLRTFTDPPQPIKALTLTTSHGWADPRSLHVADADSGRHLGTVAMGHLFVEDERDRPKVLQLLADLQVPVAQPVASPHLIQDETWPSSSVPNMWTYWFVEGLDFRPRDPEHPRTQTSVAHYNPATKKLWVQDSRLAAAACLQAARVGVEVAEVYVPRAPWTLAAEVPFNELKDRSRRQRKRSEVPTQLALLNSGRALLPEDLLPHSEVEWVATPAATRYDPESFELFLLHERFVTERQALFGPHQLSSTGAPCRLCGQPALRFTAFVSREPLDYCHQCLSYAATGISLPIRKRGTKDRAAAALALRLLGEHEFGDSPMLEQQLDSLHINPASPVPAREIDKLLLLRFAIPRHQHPWTHLLEEAGFTEDGLRISRGTLIRARDGHRCLSLMEKAVCDFLHQHHIKHEREPHYPQDSDFNVHGLRRADWLLTDGTFVEFWGLPKQADYAAKIKEKQLLAARHGLALVELVESDLRKLPDIFSRWLSTTGTGSTSWSWSPIVASDTKEQAASRTTRPEPGPHPGHVERCIKAVELQATGRTRKSIGDELGVGVHSVRDLLRDGRFYLDPQSDSERLRAALLAREAKRQGKTRAEFQTTERLSKTKAIDAWRDADVAVVVAPPATSRASEPSSTSGR